MPHILEEDTVAVMNEDLRRRLTDAMSSVMTASSHISDEMFASQVRLSAMLLSNSLRDVMDEVNPRRVKDVEFACNDLVSVSGELTDEDRNAIAPAIRQITDAVAQLKLTASLPAELAARIKEMQTKLRERRSAHERQLFKPPEAEREALPHDPGSLQTDAKELQIDLNQAGFDTPTLERLATAPAQFELRDASELIEELDVILN